MSTQYAEIEDTDFAAKIDRLLGQIARGETVTIFKQHHPVAEIVSCKDELRERRWQALMELRELRKDCFAKGLDLRAAREDGRA
ncbi:MAG: hypothetical protein LBK60_01855 [Verrucomicrobiales bacterium]|jgi:antitoxin (DNA-binding transcriptional repressor) of toxin-antitoxin stability system|nr:hypothetical protein [Verrucomicrobiales bacterium]